MSKAKKKKKSVTDKAHTQGEAAAPDPSPQRTGTRRVLPGR